MKKVLVIGDSCLDMFRYGKCERLSPEAPVPVFNPTNTVGNGGMALNVFENLKSMGIDCEILTNDLRPVKTRYVDEVSNQLLLRVDENDQIKPLTADELKKINFDDYRAIIISDYNKGYLTTADIEYVAKRHPHVFLDTKKKINTWTRDIYCIKINQKEFNENQDYLLEHFFRQLIVTKGKDGTTLNFTEDFPIENEHEVRDLSGAGDTFLAALVADFIKNDDIRSNIRFANRCASWVVTQKGVAVVDLTKISV